MVNFMRRCDKRCAAHVTCSVKGLKYARQRVVAAVRVQRCLPNCVLQCSDGSSPGARNRPFTVEKVVVGVFGWNLLTRKRR
eukprot:COSAG02_NODE_7741_length_2866_cov_1.542630_6_plen_81_part_00